jgi:hypothetical protein
MLDTKPQIQQAEGTVSRVSAKKKQKQKPKLYQGISYSNCRKDKEKI